MNLVDLVCSSQPAEATQETVWIKNTLLADLTASYRNLNLDVEWDESLIRWLVREYNNLPDENLLERIADEKITPSVMNYSNSNSNRNSNGQRQY